MRQKMEEKIWQLLLQYCRENELPVIWKHPIVRFADAAHPGFAQLKELVDPGHHIPQDYLPNAKNVLSWFLPFLPEVGRGNLHGKLSSAQWANAYLVTNEMAAWINSQLVEFIRKELGCDAAAPFDAGMISMDNPRSRWSQRHVAYIAGHGTFDLTNMKRYPGADVCGKCIVELPCSYGIPGKQ